jgi:hypothetical protein
MHVEIKINADANKIPFNSKKNTEIAGVAEND